MKLIRQGNHEAFQELFDLYNSTLLKYCRKLTGGNISRAEDLVQDIWMRVVKHSGKYNTTKPFKPWLLCVAKNRCFSAMSLESRRGNLRHNREQEILNNNHLVESARLEELNESAVKKRILELAIDQLDKDKSQAIKKWLESDFDLDELVKFTGKSKKDLHQLLYRARKKIGKNYRRIERAHYGIVNIALNEKN
jgi:RNA polymerase sigma factor (sigma-70 family)